MLEVNLLKNLDHPNIVSYKESFLAPGQMIIVMEYCDGKFATLTLKLATLLITLSENSRKKRLSQS